MGAQVTVEQVDPTVRHACASTTPIALPWTRCGWPVGSLHPVEEDAEVTCEACLDALANSADQLMYQRDYWSGEIEL